MIEKKLQLVNEQTSPLFRIVLGYDTGIPGKRKIEHNICAFHIGNGYLLSVAHHIRLEMPPVFSIPDAVYQSDILPLINANPAHVAIFKSCYQLDNVTQKWHFVRPANNIVMQQLLNLFKTITYDCRWMSLVNNNICNQYLTINFKNSLFYNDTALSRHFTPNTYFHEPTLNRHTFLIQVELVKAFSGDDISLYKIINTHQDIINKIPSISIDYNILDDGQTNLYCLQSSPSGVLGRLLNDAKIEGHLDNHSIFHDRFGGNYVMEGNRYLIKGYFRFGSSGAPYIIYDTTEDKFKVNSIQSEACPIQLSIGGNRDGNAQYINAIASPLNNIKTELEAIINPSPTHI